MNDSNAAFFVAVALPVAVAGSIYANGAWRRAEIGRPVSPIRHAAFALGLAILLASIEWPFEAWAQESFSVQQAGIMAARIVAPMLIAFSRPAGLLIAGTPRLFRRHLLQPVLSAPLRRRIWPVLSHPTSVIFIYIAALYLWEIPSVQAIALTSQAVEYLMHVSLALAGLLFWTRIFERRPAPHGPSHGSRLMMIWLAILAQILLGAYITINSSILYSAYAAIGDSPSILDQQRGGFLLWIPSSYLSLFALLAVIHMWGLHETRMDERRTRWSPSNSAILLYPETGHALREKARPKNRRMAIGLIGFILLVFGTVTGAAIGTHRINRQANLRKYVLSKS
jgi:putative membrane protein